ncbi:SIS domain-containing protein [Lactobacillus sp. ESL0684]|uniref:SIS domain-containing protein n=1 Tax=unclassified Lactobacillus TaxID=2620435 RepID=UPI0023F7F378|nr:MULTISPECIES: SIS domain-containing protein [unclassified Lactobacillus]WEV40227.1 SIS domain-containing protein [Lactobacillus sp. ESL0681]WEV43248.1 SIS domain-containing protein [Lactobacillus sp. ESL0684]
MLNEKELIKEIIDSKKEITDVYFAACGGSMNDLYPGHYFIEKESTKLHSTWKPARELTMINSPHWNEHSITFALSHSGNTPEVIEAAKLAKKKGSFVIAITNDPNSDITDPALSDELYVYDWGKETSHKDVPMGMDYRILNEFLHQTEESYQKYDQMIAGLNKIDQIVDNARKVQRPAAQKFAQKYRKQDFMYILGSGANMSQAYGFAICSLMEMQWMDCAFIDSAEFFHGPFEVLQDDHLFIQCVNTGDTRALDTRSRDFIKKYHGQLEVIDSKDFGMEEIDNSVVDYFNPIVFYEMGVLYRDELGEKRAHDTDFRQYMGKVDYSYKPSI